MSQPTKGTKTRLQFTSLEAAPPKECEDSTVDTIDWDVPHDVLNPINWSDRKRWAHIITVAILGLIP